MKQVDLAIIGGGPAGLAAAVEAYDAGVRSILIIERDVQLGGILNQCIHNGFGVHHFHEELTGPEYAQRYIDEVKKRDIDVLLNTIVIDMNAEKEITIMGKAVGLETIQAKAIILAMGCRERPRGALNTPGQRPAGIYTAGTAQRLINIEGYMPGHRVVILGSGDIGLIMARRMVLEGAEVQCVAEVMPFSGGLKRNIVQCLDDYEIPLYFNTTISKVIGRDRVEGVWLTQVDERMQPISGTERFVECDTVLLSVGLIPENELSRNMGMSMDPKTRGAVVNDRWMTDVPGIFACGNVLHVHDLVDNVSEEAEIAGRNAALYIQGALDEPTGEAIPIEAGEAVNYTLPQRIHPQTMADEVKISFRVRRLMQRKSAAVYLDGERVYSKKKHALAPGQMEQVPLKKEDVMRLNPHRIEIRVED